MPKKLLLPVFALAFSSCSAIQNVQKGMGDMMSDMTGGAMKPDDSSGYSSRSVGKSEKIPANKRGYHSKMVGVVRDITGPGFSGHQVAWAASNAKMNSHAMKTGAKAMVIAKIYVKGKYMELQFYDVKASPEDNIPWVEKAAKYYEKTSKGQSHRFSVKKNLILWFEKSDPSNQGYIDVFQNARL